MRYCLTQKPLWLIALEHFALYQHELDIINEFHFRIDE
jgi:hypothetical protein